MPLPLPLPLPALDALVATHGTPLQLYDEAAIDANARALIATFSSRFPNFRQFFAVKALPNPAILRVLVDAGCGLDCSSTAELHIAAALGVRGAAVTYTSNYTSAADLAVAAAAGVTVNLDDASLLPAFLAAPRPAGAPPPLVSFRLNPGLGRTDSESPSNVLGGPGAKFGVPPDAIVGAYAAARAAGVTRFGMHMMTGSCVTFDDYWLETVGALLAAAARVQAEAGVPAFEFLNIGGGLGIPYREGAPRVDTEALAGKLAAAWAAQAAAVGLRGPLPTLHMENGRYMTGPYGWLVARCEAVKEAFGARYYGLDASMANLMRPGMYGAYHAVSVPAREAPGAATVRANVVGTLCENNDWFARDRELPAAAARGDLFVIHDTGAHSHSMGFQYNGKLRAPELLLREQAQADGVGRVIDVVRRRETYDSLFGNTILPSDLAVRVPSAYRYKRAFAQWWGGGVVVVVGVAAAAILAGFALAKKR